VPKTVVEHVLVRLKAIGINDIFAVAGDCAFPVNGAINAVAGACAEAPADVSFVAQDRRTVLIAGEGSQQMTLQEPGQFARLGLKPIGFILNKDGYLIERLLAKDGEATDNDVAEWRYVELPHALGCDDWLCLRRTTCEELEKAGLKARAATAGVYIEAVTGRYVSSDPALRLQTAMQATSKAP
jgi:indolepyruvate decarboxylase